MIPQHFDKETTTSGERRTFEALAGLSDNYVVLHSLALEEHTRQSRGEADFVVIGPEGILCLEVKGGRVAHHDGRWIFTDHAGRTYTKTKSPWTQAADNADTIRDRLARTPGVADGIRRCLYASGVVLPDIEFGPKNVGDSSVITDILLDRRRNLPEMAAFVGRCFDHWRSRRSERDPLPMFLTSTDIYAARDRLRGDFDFVPRLDMWVSDVEASVETATNEEKERYLAQAFDHERILLTGGAGTGKTVVSREYARRRAGQGDRVLFLCFNRNLREVLRGQNKDPRVEYHSFHDHLEDALKSWGALPPRPADDSEQAQRNLFYRQTLPEAFCEIATRQHKAAPYDCLVVDEGQDLIQPLYLRCMDAMLSGGLKSGRWHICYDPNQNIYNPEGFDEGLRQLKAETTPWPYRLVVNCRNTYPIAAYNAKATQTELPRIAKIEGPRVEVIPFSDYDHEVEILRDLVRTLVRDQGVAKREIFLLSLTGFRNSCLRGNPQALGLDLSVTDLTQFKAELLTHDSVKFCTVQGFKGLEAPVVLLIDVQRLDRRDLIYTAVSRAKSVLYVLYDASLEAEHGAIMSEYLASLRGEPPELPVPRRVMRTREENTRNRETHRAGAGVGVVNGNRAPSGHATWKPSDARGLTSIREIVERKEERHKRK
jgi:hypothetical protein